MIGHPAALGRTIVLGRETRRLRSSWRITLALITGLVAFVGTFATAMAAETPFGRAQLVAWVVTALAVMTVFAIAARGLRGRPASAYGLRWSSDWWVDLAAGTVLGGLIAVLAFLIGLRLGSVQLPGGQLAVGSPSPLWLGAFAVGFVCVALWEELVFRGTVLLDGREGLVARGASRWLSTLLALFVSVALYTVVHVPGATAAGHSPWLTVAWTATFGVVLALAYLMSGDLALPMGLHFGLNYVSGNVLGIAGVAELAGVPTVLVLETTDAGLTAPMGGIPLLVALAIGGGLVVAWTAWRHGSLEWSWVEDSGPRGV